MDEFIEVSETDALLRGLGFNQGEIFTADFMRQHVYEGGFFLEIINFFARNTDDQDPEIFIDGVDWQTKSSFTSHNPDELFINNGALLFQRD